jgi:nicotinate phosphoribosyltransferase
VWRRYDADGRMALDVLSTEDDVQEGETLIVPVLQAGRLVAHRPSLQDIRAYARTQLQRLPRGFESLRSGLSYPVQVAAPLQQLAAAVDLRTR